MEESRCFNNGGCNSSIIWIIIIAIIIFCLCPGIFGGCGFDCKC